LNLERGRPARLFLTSVIKSGRDVRIPNAEKIMTRISAVLRAVCAAIPLLLAAVPPASAQTPWPQRNVRFIVPLGPGSGADIGARLFADKLSARWGKPVVVENRPGGDAIVAITAFTGARDDHTLLFAPAATFTAHPYLHDKLPYNQADLAPIARVSNTLVALVVPASLKAGTLGELMELVRAQPGRMNWATATGFSDFLLASYLKNAGLDMSKVPYRDPSSPPPTPPKDASSFTGVRSRSCARTWKAAS
jgi:tripartite-type tricarboxylate transporter receptor subunit TctC